ncbi:MAG: ATP-binding protein [Candidatus Omnitrophica bacterium]|nr:ATP-binding protein [Candidatus Omnitrophota bacterium]
MIKDKIFGRENYLEIIKQRVSGLLEGYRRNIAVIGDESVGKSSILFRFLSGFCDNRVIILYLELRHESLLSFTRRFIGVLLYNFMHNSGIPLKEDLDFLILKSERYIPRTTGKIKVLLNAVAKRKKQNIFTETLSLCEIFYQETGKCCVVIFDEFCNLEKLGVKNLYREWSRFLVAQKNTMYIITSSSKFKANAVLSRELSLLFGNFEIVTVEPFDIKTSEAYLENRLGILNLNDGLKDFLVHFTGGYPFYLEVISEELLKSSQHLQLADILEGLLFNSGGILNQRFSNYIKRFMDLPRSNDYISILYFVSSGRNKVKELSSILHRQQKELLRSLNHLLEADALVRNGDFLKINDRVFGFWLRFVYQQKLQSLSFDVKYQKEKFRGGIASMIQEFLDISGRPLIERMTRLLGLFEDETLQIERKKIRLNHFREIKRLEFNHRGLKNGLLGRSSESLWIMAMKEESLTEDDIADFSRECRRYRKNKLQKKIMLTLQDIDHNTRLRAMEEKILAWDINDLNQIMDLFFQPRVIK